MSKGYYIGAVLAALIYIIAGNRITYSENKIFADEQRAESVSAVVTKVYSQQEYSKEEYLYEGVQINMECRRKNGDIIEAVQYIDTYDQVSYKQAEVGDKIVLNSFDNGESWSFSAYDRSNYLIGFSVVFFVMLAVFGKIKGFNTILALLLTCGNIFCVLVPAILGGRNIYLWTLITCVVSISTSMVIIHGANKMTLSAVIGCIAGVCLSCVLMVGMGLMLNLTGMTDESSYYLLILDPENPVDLKAIVFSGIIISALGAVMDVAISIASPLEELCRQTGNIEQEDLFKSGINIGRDIMGTMTNTLVLAYIGSSLTEVLLLAVNNYSFLELVNREMVVVELLQTLVGSMGVLLTIPFTAFVCSRLFYNKYDMELTREEIDSFMPYVNNNEKGHS